jgi:VanZ family protein
MPVSTAKNKSVRFLSSVWVPVFLCMAAIFCVSSVPAKDIPGLFPFQDLVYHFGAYLSLGFLSSRAIKKSWNIQILKVIIITLVFGSLYAISDEFHQSLVPGRDASLVDFMVDAVGNFTGGFIYRWLV